MFDAERLEAIRTAGLADLAGGGAAMEPALRLATAALRARGAFVLVADPERPRLAAIAGPGTRLTAAGVASVDPSADASNEASSIEPEDVGGGSPDGPAEIARLLGRVILGPLVRGRVLAVGDTAETPRFVVGSGEIRVQALIAAPLRGPTGHVVAGLCLWHDEPRTWSTEDRAHLDDAVAEIGAHLRRWMVERIRISHDRPEATAPHWADLVRELERREDWFDVVLESLPAGVLVARAPDAAPVRANREFLRLMGAADLGALGNVPPLRAAAGGALPPHRHPLRRALDGEWVHGEVVSPADAAEGSEYSGDGAADVSGDSDDASARPGSRQSAVKSHADGDPTEAPPTWWRVNAAPIRAGGGEVAGAVLSVEDITEARGMQQALYRSQEHLLHAQKMEAVGRLAGGMAHDFNNLLTAIMGFGELLLEGLGGDDPARDDAREIVRSAARGRDLTTRLLSFSRRRATDPSVLDLNESVRASRRLLERLLEATVRLEAGLAPDAGRVRIDRTEVEQIVVNLALNARDALADATGTVRIETGPARLVRTLDVEPEAIPAGRWETLAVVDDGSGMDAALRLRIFEPFFTTKPAGEGTGLGLATVYGIVKRAGGFVRVDSEPGRGTAFRIYLPPAETAATPQPPIAEAAPAGGSETVLLAEDQDQIRSLLARQLERSGFRVLEAANGHEALKLWRRDPDAVDIVVSDVVMPVMDGPSMVERIREHAPDLPVVFISGYPGAADPSERETPLPDARFLRKPFAAAELVSAIRAGLDAES